MVDLLDSIPKFSDLFVNLKGVGLKLFDSELDRLELVLSNEVGLVLLELINSVI
jgi:hypothetical protein